MGLLRDKNRRLGGRNEAFWVWWASAKDRVAAGIEDGSVGSLVDEVGAHVKAVHPALAWELSQGTAARHAFCVSPEGSAEIRPVAIEWLGSAPAPDATWEYHASRQAGGPGLLDIGGHRIDLDEVRAITAWDEGRELMSVRLWHPMFASIPKPAAVQISFLFLDNLLGEDEVERWVGSVEASDAAFSGRTPQELKEEVARRAATAGRDQWVLAQRVDGKGNRAIVSANAALKRIDLPFAAHHVTVSLGLGIEQLAGRGDDRSLEDAEDELVDAMEKCGATYAGRVTEQRRRELHFVTADPDHAGEVARSWTKAHKTYAARVESKLDPKWEFRAQLLG